MMKNRMDLMASLDNAINNGKTIRIMIGVADDYTWCSVLVVPLLAKQIENYIFIHTNIGDIDVDITHLEYDVDKCCYECSGDVSSTYIYIYKNEISCF